MEQLESEAELSDVATVQRFMAATNADLQQAVAKLQSMRVERDAARQERDAMHKQLHDMKVRVLRSAAPVRATRSWWRRSRLESFVCDWVIASLVTACARANAGQQWRAAAWI